MPIAFILGALNWIKNSTVGRYLMIAGAAVLAVFVIFQRGKSAQRKQQKLDDLEFGADIRRAADEAAEKHDAENAGLSDDERRDRALKRLRDEGRLRDN